MLRPLQPLDLVRSILRGGLPGPDRAYPYHRLALDEAPQGRAGPLRALAAWPRSGFAWVWRDAGALRALAMATPRSGPLTWEVSHLWAAAAVAPVAELVARVAQEAATHGAQQVFLRLAAHDPLVELVRLGGFFPHVRETLYLATRTRRSQGPSPLPLRRARPSDLYQVFRLYSAVTPAEVRACGGVTFSQWAGSRERGRGRVQELVYVRDDVVRGWLRLSRRRDMGLIEAMVHPHEGGYLAALLEAAESALAGTATVACLVPEYQSDLAHLLALRGYSPAHEYVTLVKSMVVRSEAEERRAAVTQPTV